MLDHQADDQKLLAEVIAYYHATLKESPPALEYLQARGTNAEAIDRFRIGFADRSLGQKLPSKPLKAGKLIRSRLEQLGLFRHSGHEHFAGCVVFPIPAADGSGRIVNIYGRKINGLRLRKGTPLDLQLNDQGVWNVEAFTATNEVILCSSLLDALTFWSHGCRNVTCVSADHLAAFDEFKIQRVMVTDEALAPTLIEAGLDCFLLRLPMDVASFVQQGGDLGAVIRMAEWLGKGKRPAAPAEELVEEPGIVPDDLGDLGDEAAEPSAAQSQPAEALPVVSEPPTGPIAPVSPILPLPTEPEAEVSGDEVVIHLGHRRYRVRGLAKNLAFEVMKINLMVSTDAGLFVDTFDLYSARHRKAFITQAAIELGLEEKTIKRDVGQVLLKLEELQDVLIQAALEPTETTPAMTDEEKQDALKLLRDPHLLDRLLQDFDVVGETTNKLVSYLAAVSRKLDQPLAIVIQSSSAAGKTSLMEAVLAFVPPEDVVKFSAMTGQSLFYMGQSSLKHKVLAIVEEEGADRASYALKLLQSEGELMIASTGKEASTGRLITQEYRVEGPVMIFLTTTNIRIDEELLNRCIVLTVDEEREQTKAIHALQRQRQTLQGLLARQDRQTTIALHRNAQRLLRPLLVANPFAESLTFMDDKTRTRRDHLKYLTLIRAITLLHQHQRAIRTIDHNEQQVEYVEATLEDIELANKLAAEVLGRCIDDLPPQTRSLLAILNGMVAGRCHEQGIEPAEYRFRRRDLREFCGWGDTQLKVHLRRLVELEYVLAHRGEQRQHQYELLVDEPPTTGKFMAGLIDVTHLRCERSGQMGKRSALGRASVGGRSALGRGAKIAATPDGQSSQPASEPKVDQNANLDQ